MASRLPGAAMRLRSLASVRVSTRAGARSLLHCRSSWRANNAWPAAAPVQGCANYPPKLVCQCYSIFALSPFAVTHCSSFELPCSSPWGCCARPGFVFGRRVRGGPFSAQPKRLKNFQLKLVRRAISELCPSVRSVAALGAAQVGQSWPDFACGAPGALCFPCQRQPC